MADTKQVTGITGQPIQIVLQSNVGSTGYGWYLTDLDGGLGLYTSCTHPTSTMPGAPVNHSFDFLALKAGSFKVVFQLLAPWRLSEPAQTEVYEVKIKAPAKTAEADLEAAMKTKDFVGPEATVLKYAAPMASPVLKYGVPPVVPEYAAPMAMPYAAPMTGSVASAHLPCPPYSYTHPDPRVTSPQVTILYAAPITSHGHLQPLYAAPMPFPAGPHPMYAAPMVQPHSIAPMYASPYYRAACTNLAYAAPPVMPPYAAPGTGCC